MAEPTVFETMNGVYGKPTDMTDEQCGSLPVLKTDSHVISCWKLSEEELEMVKKTGVVWVGILGHTVIPFWVAGGDIMSIYAPKDEVQP